MIDLSIIIVNYNVKKELFECLSSIKNSKTKKRIEIIVVDNDEQKKIKTELRIKFPNVKYIPSKKNLGFGGGNNLGAKYARGRFLYFLNPDTEVLQGSIDALLDIFKKNKTIGIVAPILLDANKKIIPLQGAKTLTPLRAIFSFSLIVRLFPKNKISRNFWLSGWSRKKTKKVDSVPGTAFVIRKEVFEEIGGFDENFFLYFEEYDLCNRVRDCGFSILIHPQARVVHKMGKSTGKSDKDSINRIFEKSRFYYFKKNYGLFYALLVWIVFSLNKKNALLLVTLFLAGFLRFYKLSTLMPFIGDYAWFYLSARDIIINGKIPLIGIASSHPWLHQGPLWTYMLAIALWAGEFNPVWGAYLTSVIGVATVFLLYKLCQEFFSEKIALVAAFLYATSPLVVFHSRAAYHTSPIPFIVLLFIYFLIKWIKGNSKMFPLLLFFIAILYNLELATILLWVPVIVLITIGFYKRKKWATKIFNFRIIGLSVLLFFLPMIPFLIYDFKNGFPQTLKFSEWIGYRALIILGFIKRSPLEKGTIIQTFNFFVDNLRKLFFIESLPVAALIAVFILIFSICYLLKKRGEVNLIFLVIFTLTLFLSLTFVLNKVPSDAYLPVMFPGVIIVLAFCLSHFPKKLLILTVLLIGFFNVKFILESSFFTQQGKPYFYQPISEKISIAKQVINESNGQDYNIVMKGVNSQFESTAMPYQYLTWFMGKEPSIKPQRLKIVIWESQEGTTVEKMLR